MALLWSARVLCVWCSNNNVWRGGLRELSFNVKDNLPSCVSSGWECCVCVMNVGWLDGRASNGDSVFFVDFVAHAMLPNLTKCASRRNCHTSLAEDDTSHNKCECV